MLHPQIWLYWRHSSSHQQPLRSCPLQAGWANNIPYRNPEAALPSLQHHASLLPLPPQRPQGGGGTTTAGGHTTRAGTPAGGLQVEVVAKSHRHSGGTTNIPQCSPVLMFVIHALSTYLIHGGNRNLPAILAPGRRATSGRCIHVLSARLTIPFPRRFRICKQRKARPQGGGGTRTAGGLQVEGEGLVYMDASHSTP